MANLSIILSATLTVTDTTISPSPTIVQRSLNNPTLLATVSFYDPFFQCTGATTVNLPAATVWIVYVKNLDAAANLTVTFTPAGGASETVLLVPGGIFLYFQPSEGAGGITALSLTPSAGTISADVYVAK
jgi:hypothetical protein